MTDIQEYIDRVRENKLEALIILLLGVAIVGIILPNFLGASTQSFAGTSEEFESRSLEQQRSVGGAGDATREPSDLQIKTGSATIDSDNAENDFSKLKTEVTEREGWIEDRSRSERDTEVIIRTTVKVPSDDFESFASWLQENFNVEDSEFGFHRATTERQQRQIEILLDAQKRYNRLLDKVESEDPSPQQAQVIMEITQAKLEVSRLLDQYGYAAEQVERRANMSTVHITFREDKQVEYIPKDVGREFKLNIKEAISILVNGATEAIIVFAKTLKWIAYAFLVIVPALIGYKWLRRLAKWVNKRI